MVKHSSINDYLLGLPCSFDLQPTSSWIAAHHTKPNWTLQNGRLIAVLCHINDTESHIKSMHSYDVNFNRITPCVVVLWE